MRLTWWGHAGVVIDVDGTRIVTDPALTRHLAHLRRVAAPVPADQLDEPVDAVLVSHLHADHLHVPSMRRLRPRLVVVPEGAEVIARRARPGAVEQVSAGRRLSLAPSVGVRAVRAEHDGRRLPGSRARGPALGYVLEAGGLRVWFAGDTGPFDAMVDIGPVDVALVPVGGWGPTLGDGHLDPAQAAEAVARVGARHAVPIHYGTYWPVGLKPLAPGTFRRMFDEPGRRFVDAVRATGSGATVHLLGVGESVDVGGEV